MYLVSIPSRCNDHCVAQETHLTLQASGRLATPSRQDGRLVHQILQVGTAEAGSS